MRRLIWLWALAGCDGDSAPYLRSEPESPLRLSTVAACPVYERGQLVGADLFFSYDDSSGADPQLLDFVGFAHTTAEDGEDVYHEGLLVETKTGESTVVRPEFVRLERRRLFDEPWAGSLAYAFALDEAAPGTRVNTAALVQEMYPRFFAGGVAFSEEVVREQPMLDSFPPALDTLLPWNDPVFYHPYMFPRWLGYRQAISRAATMLSGRTGARVILLDTTHRIHPDLEWPALNTLAGALGNDEMTAIAADLQAARAMLIVTQQVGVLDSVPRTLLFDIVEPDLQRLACQSGGFLMPAAAGGYGIWYDYYLWPALQAHWRLRIAWPPMEPQPVILTGWIVNSRNPVVNKVKLVAAWRQSE